MPSPDVGIAEAAKAIRDDILTIRMDNALRLDDHLDSHWIDVLCERAARAAYASLRAATAPVAPVRGDGELGAPEGWALVPIKPTPAMATAGDMYTNCGGACGNRAGAAAWAAMLCAAPKLPTPDSQQPEGKGDA